MSDETICGVSFDQFVVDMEAFHGDRAPGIVVGGLMLDAALVKVGETPELAIVVETYNCLPDAAQILTHCTIGNGGLTVYDWGKFALTAYNRDSLKGVRSWIVADAVAKWPLIDQWFNPKMPRIGPPEFMPLAKELIRAREELIGTKDVSIVMKEDAGQKKRTGICPDCGESYFIKCGTKCSACQGLAYYRI